MLDGKHSDGLLGGRSKVRDLAREIYGAVEGAAIISPHGHVSARSLAENRPFNGPSELFITPDHYVTRLLHSIGIPLEQLGLGDEPGDQRSVWRRLCENWHVFAGTPTRYWLEDSLSRVFGIAQSPSAHNADELYDEISSYLGAPEFRPRELLARFNVEVLATTDDPVDGLEHHEHLEQAADLPTRVIPTLRADAYMAPGTDTWRERLHALTDVTGQDCENYSGLLEAIRMRRAFFKEHGATATDCGVRDAWATPLSRRQAEVLHRQGLDGSITPEGVEAYRRNMLFEFGCMAAEDGLVMQLHAGILRNHHTPTFERFGPDTGHDLPLVASYTEPLRELLNAVGTCPTFRIVLFTVDESTFSRDIAPLAGFYPSVYAGAPWWFLDAPAAARRYRAAITETAGFYKTSGFIDDTRALCSIPARHDASRRLDATYLAELVSEHQLEIDDAHSIMQALVRDIPHAVFRLS